MVQKGKRIMAPKVGPDHKVAAVHLERKENGGEKGASEASLSVVDCWSQLVGKFCFAKRQF